MIELGTQSFWQSVRDNPAALAREVCQIDLVNIDQTLQQHPALRAWINAVYETARVEEERAKWSLTRAHARALLDAKSSPDPATGKAKTAVVLEAEATLDERVIEATAVLHDAQQVRGALRAMADALEDRKDMLVQIAAKQRKEREDYR